MRGLRSAGTLAALTALTLTCTACSRGSSGGADTGTTSSGSGNASNTARASTTSHPSTTTPPAGPVVPSAARSHTPAGAVAFVKFYIDEVNTAWTTPQTGLIPALSLPTCKSCAELESAAQNLGHDASRFTTPPITISETEWGQDRNSHTDVVVATVTQRPTAMISGARTTPPTGAPESTRRAFELSWEPDGWRVSAIKDYQ